MPGYALSVSYTHLDVYKRQAVAYLDDGTMIVVENGRKYIGDNITVIVTSICLLYTSRCV